MTAGIALDLLPGVRSHLRAVCADLRVGRTCLWLLPEWVRAPEHWERLVARLRDGVDLVEVEHVPAGRTTGPAGASESSMPASSVVSITTGDDILDSLFGPTAPRRPPPAAVSVGTPLLDRVLAAIADYGYPAADRDDDPVTALARWRSPHGLVLVVRADGEADTRGLRDLLERYPVLGREQALDREGMASLLIIGAPTAVPGVEQADPLITATHWWWGVVRRLDLVVLASDMSRSGRPPPHRKLLDELCGDLVPEIIAEIAGPDLDLAVELVRHWDGTQRQLRELVRKVAKGSPAAVEGPRQSAARPPRQLWDSWAAGDVAEWDGTIRRPFCALSEDMVDAEVGKRLWIAHTRALNSLLDEIRGAVVHHVAESFPVRTVARLATEFGSGGDIVDLELGPLRKAVRADVLDLKAHWSGLLDTAVAVRNQLAHREPARDDLLRKLQRYWTDVGFR